MSPLPARVHQLAEVSVLRDEYTPLAISVALLALRKRFIKITKGARFRALTDISARGLIHWSAPFYERLSLHYPDRDSLRGDE